MNFNNLAILLAFMSCALSCHRQESRAEMRMKSQAFKELNYILLSVSSYIDIKGDSPKNIFDAAQVWGEIPASWLKNNKAVDPWGNEYHLVVDDKKIFTYTSGPNQVNEFGLGDDISREMPYPDK